ncbi:integrase core domain-containing protein [Streptomyces canus]
MVRLEIRYDHGTELATCRVTLTLNQFRHTYNTLRPHQALDDRTP